MLNPTELDNIARHVIDTVERGIEKGFELRTMPI